MKRTLTFIIALLLLSRICEAQTDRSASAFGTVDTADLRLSGCGFEKDAKAMILFDKADVYACADSVVMMRHKRIKLFKDYDKDITAITLTYHSYHNFETVSSIEAQTISIENNKITIVKLDPKLIYTEVVDKSEKKMVFVFPEVKPGCIIEYRYKWKTISPANFPTWFFQNTIPTRYSELDATMSAQVDYKTLNKGTQPLVLDTNEVVSLKRKEGKAGRKYYWAKSNLHSLVMEPFITPGKMNFQYMLFQLHSLSMEGTTQQAPFDSWQKIAGGMVRDEDFGLQLNKELSKEDTIIKRAQQFNTNDEKIAYLFTTVKRNMKWNNVDRWYTDDGVKKAWSKKTGNSTEINLILYNLLTRSGVKAYPMAVCTRDNGTINPSYASFSLINKVVIYVPADSNKIYVLDASDKYNVYKNVPAELLNTYGMVIYPMGGWVTSNMVFLKSDAPAQQVISINAQIKPDSKITGTAETNYYSYNRANYQLLYDKLGESKYIDMLRGDDNKLKISDLSFENSAVDTLPLVQKLNFDLQLSASDDNYIYFDPNLFSSLKTNPFLSEQRFSDIDLGTCNALYVTGYYKLPQGYKVDVLPKNTLLHMDDNSIRVKRLVGVDNDTVEINYTIVFKRSLFSVTEYASLRDFYKKMYELLNEPVVLKKGL